MHPPWFKLLKQWQDSHRFGLTIPFIYGALDNWSGAPLGADGHPEEKFTRLLQSIADGTSGRAVMRLFPCGTVEDLTLAPVFGVPNFCVPIECSGDLPPTLWVQKELLYGHQNNCVTLAQVLWARYSAPIIEGRYSLHEGAFVPFDAADLRLIQLAAEREDDDT